MAVATQDGKLNGLEIWCHRKNPGGTISLWAAAGSKLRAASSRRQII